MRKFVCLLLLLFVGIIERRPRMGRVQGGARAAFATPSWGPARMTFIVHFSLTAFYKYPYL